MSGLITDLSYVYIQIGFMALFCLVVMALVIWWFTKGRKQQTEERDKMVKEMARTSAVIENNTAVINNNTEVIKMYGQLAAGIREELQRFDERITRQGEQHDEMIKGLAVLIDRTK